MNVIPIEFKDNALILLDQRKLPQALEYIEVTTLEDTYLAIKDMIVRGAPAIGITGAYGMVLAALKYAEEAETFFPDMEAAARYLISSRPTAVNLEWAIKSMMDTLKNNKEKTQAEICEILLVKARQIHKEDLEANCRMAEYGDSLVPKNAHILTHCNAGALATAGYGTALGVIRKAHKQGKNIHVYADETRPRLQGASLTSWELMAENIPVTLLPDSAAATLIRDHKVDLIITGADRIALNGDTANKIGTYMLSALAKIHSVPFYIAAPLSTIDFSIETGKEIIIEERDAREVTHIQGIQIAPEGVDVYNPAFDVTPGENITAIITEKGIIRPPFSENILKLKKGAL